MEQNSQTAGPFIVESRLRPRYAETDAQGVVHHSNYLVWFEVARTDYCDALGFPYTEIERQGYGFVVTDLSIKYLSPARFDDRLIVRSWVEKIGRASCIFGYQIYNETTAKICVEGMTKHAAVSTAGKLIAFGPELYQALGARVGRGPSRYGLLKS